MSIVDLSYPKVLHLGVRGTEGIFDGLVRVEEKLDGSQFSFGVIDGRLVCRSKNQDLDLENPDKMFAQAVIEVRRVAEYIQEGILFTGEYFQKPKHNILAYSRVPAGQIALFGLRNLLVGKWLGYETLRECADLLGFEPIQVLFEGEVKNEEQLHELLDQESQLGGCKIEGIVIKNPRLPEVAVKVVGANFREKQGLKAKRPGAENDPVKRIAEQYAVEARWHKAVQHLKEQGKLTGTPKDIPLLVKEAKSDIRTECGTEIAEALTKMLLGKVLSGAVDGLPEWYLSQLRGAAFSEGE